MRSCGLKVEELKVKAAVTRREDKQNEESKERSRMMGR
jgi:hypothetical protein